jgi:hypothetical protein
MTVQQNKVRFKNILGWREYLYPHKKNNFYMHFHQKIYFYMQFLVNMPKL